LGGRGTHCHGNTECRRARPAFSRSGSTCSRRSAGRASVRRRQPTAATTAARS
jgi:hypothetical protein